MAAIAGADYSTPVVSLVGILLFDREALTSNLFMGTDHGTKQLTKGFGMLLGGCFVRKASDEERCAQS